MNLLAANSTTPVSQSMSSMLKLLLVRVSIITLQVAYAMPTTYSDFNYHPSDTVHQLWDFSHYLFYISTGSCIIHKYVHSHLIPDQKSRKHAKRRITSVSQSMSSMLKLLLVMVFFTTLQVAHAMPTTYSDFNYHLSSTTQFSDCSSLSDSSINDSSSSSDSGLSDFSEISTDSGQEDNFAGFKPVPNVPNPEALDSTEFRILAMNVDGCKDWAGIYKQAKAKDVHALLLVDAQKPTKHGITHRALKQNFSHDSAVSINQGLQKLSGGSLGGTVSAIAKGWNQRCAGFSNDKFNWGRYSVLKLRGKIRQSIWIVSLYSPYPNLDGADSYYNLLLLSMKEYEAASGKRLERKADGDLCPYCQLRKELSLLLSDARAAGAELVITGDFNEKWHMNGEFRQWAQTNNLQNVLDPDSETGGATTCFPTSGAPSDIDWVLSTPGLHSAGMIKAGVLHEAVSNSRHVPIFISIKALQWLKLKNADVASYKQHKHVKNYIIGTSDNTRVQTYQKLLTKNWSKFKVPELKSNAEAACSNLSGAIAEGKAESELANLRLDSGIALQLSYNAVNDAFTKSMNQMSHRYAVGGKGFGKRLIYYSTQMIEIRRMLTRAEKFAIMWKRRLQQQSSPFENASQRGRHKGGKRNARGKNPTMNELKYRLIRWFDRAQALHDKIPQLREPIAETLLYLNVERQPERPTQQIAKWQRVFDVVEKIIPLLKSMISVKNRLQLKNDQHDGGDRKKRKKRGLKQIILNLSLPKHRGGGISKVEHNGELITDPTQVCSRLISFYDAWFGAGRQNRWNVDAAGQPAHPLCRKNERSVELIHALLEGKYSHVAEEHESLPSAVQKLYDLGLFSYKTITKGPKKGRKVKQSDMQSLLTPPTPTEWRCAKRKLTKCTHPGKDGITKPSLFHCPYHLYMDVGHLVFLAEEHGHVFDQHRQVQMWLIPKDTDTPCPALERLRALWFEAEILKIYEFIMEGRTDALCRNLGLLEAEQSGFEKGKDCGSSIFPVSQLIEDSRMSNRELWLAFLDQAKAFDTLESFQGKLMASMVLGIPFEYANKFVKFDESVIAEILTCFGTSAEILGFDEGTFLPQCGGLQGGPRSPGMWKRFYDLLIKAQKLITAGKLAFIEGEDGNEIILTSEVYADDTLLPSGDQENLHARKECQQDFIDYSGSNVNPVKCILAAILRDAGGDLRGIEESENIKFKSINDLSIGACTTIGPEDPFRYLGWWSCVSIATDQAFIKMFEVQKKCVDYIYTRKTNNTEITMHTKIKTLPSVQWRMRYSNTGEESISVLQRMYNKLLRSKTHLIPGFPKNLMYASEKCCGLGFVNFWDAISIDRVVTYLKHSFTSGREEEIFAAAVKRSELQQQSRTPVLECKQVRPWDSTILGRVKEFLVQTDFTISGGKINCGHRNNDISILDLDIKPRDRKMVYAGCKLSGIFWKSQCLSDDGITWISDFQHTGKYANTNSKFVWFNFRTDYHTGGRIHVRKESRWLLWLEKIKKLLKGADLGLPLGKYFSDALPILQPFDVVISSDSALPKIIIDQTENQIRYIQCGIPARIGARMIRSQAQDAAGWRWGSRDMGITDDTCYAGNRTVFATDATRFLIMPRASVIRVSASIFPIKTGVRQFRHATLQDALNEQGSFGKLGGVFLRYAIDPGCKARMFNHNVVSNLPKFQWPSTYEKCVSLQDFIGEGNAGVLKRPMARQFAEWRVKASLFKKGGIIAGGDGSAKELPEGQEAAFAWCVLAIGNLTMKDIARKPASWVKILASGGSADWVMRVFRTNTRAEKLHILAAMIALLAAGLNVYYAVDYEGAIFTVLSVSEWTASEWCNAEDRDVMRAILWMEKQWEMVGLKFTIFKMRAHPEKWCSLPPSQYTAIQQIAVLTDTSAKAVFERCKGQGKRPYLPGQFRFCLKYKGLEVVGPLRKFLKNTINYGYIHKYVGNKKHNGNLHRVNELTEWQSIKRWSNKCWNGFSPVSNTKYLFNRWATLFYQSKVGILPKTDDGAEMLCHCGQVEDTWHILGDGLCSGFDIIRKKHSDSRLDLMIELGLSDDAIRSIRDNLGTTANGSYLDWNAESFELFHLSSATTKWLQTGQGFFSHWFQKGPLPVGFIEQSTAVLGLSSKKARKFGEAWFNSKRIEAAELWSRRNDLRHKTRQELADLNSGLRAKLLELVSHRRKQGWHAFSNRVYNRMHGQRLKSLITRYEAEVEDENANQPLILNAFQAQGLSPQRAMAFHSNASEISRIAKSRSAAIKRRRINSAALANEQTRMIDTVFDADYEVGIEVDPEGDSSEAREVVQHFIDNSILDEPIDQEARIEICSVVENIMHLGDNKQAWEI